MGIRLRGRSKTKMEKPNILLLTTDQHNAEILGCAGNTIVQTPNIDALAKRGIFFTQAFTPFPLCTPARTSIFTGLEPRHHGVKHNINMNYSPGPYALAPEYIAFPELLRKTGYRTYFIGKLHTRHEEGKNFGLHITKLIEGKCHFVDSPKKQDLYRQYLIRRGYPKDIWKIWENPEYVKNGYVTSPLPEEDYIDTFIANLAIKQLEEIETPFFMWVSFCTPHNPWDPPTPYDKMYDPEKIPFPHRVIGELETKPRRWADQIARTISALPATSIDPSLPGGVENAYKRFPEDKTRRMLAAYYGEITHVDRQIGRLLDALRKEGFLKNTLIIFTSDHGEYLGNNWAFYKGSGLYDSLIRVPLILSWPEKLPGGRKVSSLVSLVDLAPTILDACGVHTEIRMDGDSLLPLIMGETDSWRKELLIESGASKAILTEKWKFIKWKDHTVELYDRIEDPHDHYNLAFDSSTRSTRELLCKRLEAIYTR